jgi:hypothetical protein
VGTEIASGTSTVSTWYMTTVTYLDLSWQTATLDISDRPAGTIFYLTNGYIFNTRDPNLNFPDAPEATSGSIVVSMHFQAYWGHTTRAMFTFGTLEPMDISSILSTLTDVPPLTSQTSSQPADTANAGNANDNDSDPSLSSGAIAGIAIGGVLALALIIGGWYFWQRRKRAKTAKSIFEEDRLARGYGDAPEVDTKYVPQEMPGSGQSEAKELDSTQNSKYATNGYHELMVDQGEYNYKPAHELNPESRLGELSNGETTQTLPVRHQDLEPGLATTEMTGNATSPNIEAQRRREMEWLEMEEERIRKRRETLALQGGART